MSNINNIYIEENCSDRIVTEALIPHRNNVYSIKQVQKFFCERYDALPFLPIFAPFSFSGDLVKSPAFVCAPEFSDGWIYLPVRFENDAQNLATSAIKIAGFPTFPKTFSIPICFAPKKTTAISTDFSSQENYSANYCNNYIEESLQISFPIKLRVFKTATFNFSWPLDEQSKETLHKKMKDSKLSSPPESSLSFNWHIERKKWKK